MPTSDEMEPLSEAQLDELEDDASNCTGMPPRLTFVLRAVAELRRARAERLVLSVEEVEVLRDLRERTDERKGGRHAALVTILDRLVARGAR